MKKILLLIILYSTFSKSQNIFSLKSSDDGLPIKYAHIFANEATIKSPTIVAGNTTMQTLEGNFETQADIFSLQFNYKF